MKTDGLMVKNLAAVSIVVPCYNASATLDATLNSVLLQEYSNYEVVIIDDGSIDETPKIIKKSKFSPDQSGSFCGKK